MEIICFLLLGFSVPVSICLSFVSVAVWGKAGCVWSLFCDSVFVCFDVFLGSLVCVCVCVWRGGGVFGICTHFTSYFVILF